MTTALVSSRLETSKSPANVFEREKTGLFTLEHQLRTLFFDLQGRYENILFKLNSSGQPLDISLSPDELAGLFKIVLEAVDNCLRHSFASSIEADVKLINHNLIQFSIDDNGAGFNLDKVAETKKHSGLKRICYYAQQVNARVVFNSTPGRGTQVVIAKSVEKQKARFYTRLVALF